MKKFTLVALAMMASASCFAQTTQTTLWNGEDKSDGLWTRCTPEIVDNPLKDGINPSDKCVKFTITKGNFEKESIVLDLKKVCGETGLNMQDNKRLSIMIKKSIANNIKVELSAGENTYWKHIASWCNGNDQWQKLVFDFTDNCDFGKNGYPTELAIYPIIDDGQPNSQEIFVDNIVLEANPTVDGKSLWYDVADNSLEGKLELTGGYFKTTCMNADVDPWTPKNIDDFAKLNDKLSANVTSIDMRKASTLGVDINKFFENKNPNTIVYANENYEHANVVVGVKDAGIADNLELTDANAFNAPEGFKAKSVKLTRDVQSKINSFVLPFKVTADELGATKVATYASNNKNGDKTVYFDKVPEVAANTPFLAEFLGDKNELSFSDKTIAVTPESLGTKFEGVYVPQNAEGKYGIDGEGKLHKGGATATIDAFHAYLNVTGSAAPAAVAFNDSTPTAINGVAADKVANTAVYDLSGRRVYGKLQKGLYIMNGKKVVVK